MCLLDSQKTLRRVRNFFRNICCSLVGSSSHYSEKSLLAAAEQMTGLTNWGDKSFLIPMRALLASYANDANLNAKGSSEIREMVIWHLANRLRIQKALCDFPDIAQQEIRRPLFIVGIPRSGTTLLQRLLANDATNRSLRFWEALQPAPPPDPSHGSLDTRIALAQKTIQHILKLIPDYQAIHPMSEDSPEECSILFMNSFLSNFFLLYGSAYSYGKMLQSWQGWQQAYKYYRIQLKILQFLDQRERWLLKAPMHLEHLDSLLSVFPDACIIQTHRDPVKTIPSSCSQHSRWHAAFSTDIDFAQQGQHASNKIELSIEKGNRAREGFEDRFYDVRFTDLVENPIGIVNAIYKRFNIPYNNGIEDRINTWLEANSQGKHGIHHYSCEQFGLDPEALSRKFAEYRSRYGIEGEL